MKAFVTMTASVTLILLSCLLTVASSADDAAGEAASEAADEPLLGLMDYVLLGLFAAAAYWYFFVKDKGSDPQVSRHV